MAILGLCSLSKSCHRADESTGDGNELLANMGQRANSMGQLGGQFAQGRSKGLSQGQSSGIADGSTSHKALDVVMGQLQTIPSRTESADISESWTDEEFGSSTQPGEPLRIHTVSEHTLPVEEETEKLSETGTGHTKSENQNDSENQWVIKDQEHY